EGGRSRGGAEEEVEGVREGRGRRLSQAQTLQTQLAAAQRAMAQVSAATACMQTSTATEVIFTNCNVHIRNGSGNTFTANGLGNLIIGYNENKSPALDRSGSHNVVIGPYHSYS